MVDKKINMARSADDKRIEQYAEVESSQYNINLAEKVFDTWLEKFNVYKGNKQLLRDLNIASVKLKSELFTLDEKIKERRISPQDKEHIIELNIQISDKYRKCKEFIESVEDPILKLAERVLDQAKKERKNLEWALKVLKPQDYGLEPFTVAEVNTAVETLERSIEEMSKNGRKPKIIKDIKKAALFLLTLITRGRVLSAERLSELNLKEERAKDSRLLLTISNASLGFDVPSEKIRIIVNIDGETYIYPGREWEVPYAKMPSRSFPLYKGDGGKHGISFTMLGEDGTVYEQETSLMIDEQGIQKSMEQNVFIPLSWRTRRASDLGDGTIQFRINRRK